MLLQPSKMKVGHIYTYVGSYNTFAIWIFAVGEVIQYFEGTISNPTRIRNISFESRNRKMWTTREGHDITSPTTIQIFTLAIIPELVLIMKRILISQLSFQDTYLKYASLFPLEVKRSLITGIFAQLL